MIGVYIKLPCSALSWEDTTALPHTFCCIIESFSAWRNICASYLAHAKNSTSCYNGINYSLFTPPLTDQHDKAASQHGTHIACAEWDPQGFSKHLLTWECQNSSPGPTKAQFPSQHWGKARDGTPSFPPSLPWLPGATALSAAHTVFLFNNYSFSEVTNSLQLRERIKTGKACDGVCMEYCPALEKQQLRSRISGLGALKGYGLFHEFTWFSVPRRHPNTFQSLYD